MYCTNCGEEVKNNAVVCLKCGVPVNAAGSQESIDNNLVGAILTTVFCCQIFGIISIVYAAQVNSKLRVGDVAGAQDSANKSVTWMWWGVGVGLIFIICQILLAFAAEM